MPASNHNKCIFDNAPDLQPNMSPVVGDEKDYVIRRVSAIYGLRNARHFPGANPVSIEKADLPQLAGRTFFAGLKTDGCRYALLMYMYHNEPRAVMINRAMCMWETEMWAPITYFESETLLDGELTWERLGSGLRQLYLIFDAVRIRTSYLEIPYRERLNAVHRHLLSDLPAGLSCDSEEVSQLILDEDKIFLASADMRMSPKGFVGLESVAQLWNSRHQTLHQNDGVILIADEPVHTGTDRSTFKWKPAESISLDVLVTGESCVPKARHRGTLIALTELKVDGALYSVHLETGKMEELNRFRAPQGEQGQGAVVECICRVEGNKLTLLPTRRRADKVQPNEISTAVATLRNVLEDIKVTDLCVSTSEGADCTENRPGSDSTSTVHAQSDSSAAGGDAAEHPDSLCPRRRSRRIRGASAEEGAPPAKRNL